MTYRTSQSLIEEYRVASSQAPELLRMDEAADLLNVSRSKAYELAQRREIPTVVVGHSVRVPRRRLLAWIEERTRGGEPSMPHREGFASGGAMEDG
jgi:excisionase family DNA binding protein